MNRATLLKALRFTPFKAGLLLILFALFGYTKLGWRKLDIIVSIDNRIMDWMFQIRGEQGTTDSVAIVDIDERSLRRLGQWPWARSVVADLVRKIDGAGAAVMGFDVVFAEEDRSSLKNFEEALRSKGYLKDGADLGEEDNDLVLGDAVAETKTALGYFMQFADDGVPPGDVLPFPEFSMPVVAFDDDEQLKKAVRRIPRAMRPTLNIESVAQAPTEGFYNALPDSSGLVRRVPLFVRYGDMFYPHLTVEMIRFVDAAAGNVQHPTLAVDKFGITGITLGGRPVPTDLECQLLVNHRGTEGTFPYVSAADVVDSKPDALAKLDGKFVLIGTSAWGLRDLRATPFKEAFPGVEILATVIDNILAGDALRRDVLTEFGLAYTIIGVAGIVLTLLLSYVGALAGAVTGATVVIGTVLVNYHYFFLHRHQIVGMVYPLVTLVVVFVVVSVLNYFFEGKEKRVIRGMFSTMVSGDVLKYMEDNPGSFSLAGEQRHATMFFSDVAGFTTISESLTPEDLVRLLNAYLTPMTEIIMGYQGYVDKYEGDAIMAEWGVPFPSEDHAQLACYAALEQQAALAEMREDLFQRFGHRLFVRMGMNSGLVSAGNMGSTRRFSYTVMGDAVNQAARFEPANKDYDTDIMMGASTYELAKNHIETRLLDKIIVKGKTEPIMIYELIAKKGEATADKLEVADLYVKALETHWERNFNDAIATLQKGLVIDADDGPTKALLERIERYKTAPPPDSWQGEYVRTSKD